MNYPLISEYIESIMSAEDNFDQLSSLCPVLDSYGNPVMSSGNFAVVFKMKDIDTGKFYAVKCFIKDQEGRNESYAMIADELKNVNSQYILPIKFLEKELFVDTSQSDETEFPVLVMDWVDGKTLDAYLREILDNQYKLQVLAYHFCQMAAWLLAQPFAHGDLKPDNILVRENGSLVLVDYDGFYVPAMKGEEARELGSPDFRHPLRTANDFDEHIDDFSIATIALSLKAISIDAQLYHNYAASDRLLLSANDYHDIGNSKTMQRITQLASDPELATIIGAFYIALSNKTLKKISNNVFDIEMPAIVIGEGKTIITIEDVKQAEKEYGELTNVVIAGSVTGIGKSAFSFCRGLTSLIIPDSVTSIGSYAFCGCSGLTSLTIPDSVTSIGSSAFSFCSGLTSIVVDGRNKKYDSRENSNAIIETDTNTLIVGFKKTIIPDSVTSIGDTAFCGCSGLTSLTIPDSVTSIGDTAFSCCSGLTSLIIPDSVTSIGSDAFSRCSGLTSLIIPGSVTEIGSNAFCGCSGMTSLIIPDSVTSIGSYAFWGCSGLTSLTIPDSVTSIGTYAFRDCSGLTSLIIPDSVTSIGSDAFCDCSGLISIVVDGRNKKYDSRDNCNAIIEKSTNSLLVGCKNTIIPDSVTTIGDRAFYGCSGLTSVTIPNSVTTIGDNAFSFCRGLTSVTIPNSVTMIGDNAFYFCSGLTSVTIPNSVTYIGDYAFYGCTGLTSITIPNSVTTIGDWAFSFCSGLTSVTIPNSVTTIGDGAFLGCSGLTSVTIPNSVTKIGDNAFEGLLEPDLHSKLVEQ